MAGHYPGDWSRAEFDKRVNTAFYVNKQDRISLDVEHASYINIQNMLTWAQEMGYPAVEHEMSETVVVYKDPPTKLKYENT